MKEVSSLWKITVPDLKTSFHIDQYDLVSTTELQDPIKTETVLVIHLKLGLENHQNFILCSGGEPRPG